MLADKAKKWRLLEQEKGIASAAEQARVEQAQLCIKVLEKRFGTVDPFSRCRIESASKQDLAQWFLDFYDAQSVRALVGGE